MKRILTDRLFQGSLELLGCSDIKLHNEPVTNDIFLAFKYESTNIVLKFHKVNNDGDYIIFIDFMFKNKEYHCKKYNLNTNIYATKYLMGYAQQLFLNIIELIKDEYGELFNV